MSILIPCSGKCLHCSQVSCLDCCSVERRGRVAAECCTAAKTENNLHETRYFAIFVANLEKGCCLFVARRNIV